MGTIFNSAHNKDPPAVNRYPPCYRCGKTNQALEKCFCTQMKCRSCGKLGHLARMRRKKQSHNGGSTKETWGLHQGNLGTPPRKPGGSTKETNIVANEELNVASCYRRHGGLVADEYKYGEVPGCYYAGPKKNLPTLEAARLQHWTCYYWAISMI